MEEEIVNAFAPKLWNRHASAPEIVVNMIPLLILVLYFAWASAPKRWGQRRGEAFAPEIKEEKWIY